MVDTALDKLQRALSPIVTARVDGPHTLNVTGTVNILGAGSGGTSSIDNSPFTAGGSSLTPMGGYYGGRTIGSGNVAVPALNASGLLQVDLTSVPTVDYRAGLVATMWPISHAGSGNLAIIGAPSGGLAGRIKLHQILLVNSGSATLQFQSPSGTVITGSLSIVPGGGFAQAAPIGTPVFLGATNATINLNVTGSQNIGGWATGVIEP